MKGQFNKPPSKQEKLKIEFGFAGPEDLGALKILREEAIKSQDAHTFASTSESVKQETSRTEEEWKKFFFDNNGFVAVARSGSEIVGMNLGLEKKPEEKMWRMRALYVKPGFRKTGFRKFSS